MAIQFIPRNTPTLGESFGTGLSSGIQRLVDQRMKALERQELQKEQIPGLEYLYPDASTEQLMGLSALGPSAHKGAARGIEAARMQQRMGGTAQGALQNLKELQQGGNVDKSLFGLLGGQDADTFDLYSKELGQLAKKLDPSIVVPNSKMDKKTRDEAIARIENKLAPFIQGLQRTSRGGQPTPQEMQQQQLSQALNPASQQQPAQQQGEESYAGTILRNLAGILGKSGSTLALKGGMELGKRGIAGATGIGAIPLISDLLQAGETGGFDAAQWIVDKLPLSEKERGIWTKMIQEGRPKEGERISDYLPTTSNIKNLVGKILPDGIFETKSRGEEVVQDAISKALGLKLFTNMGTGLSLASAGAGVGAREVSKDLGFGPLAQNAAELVFTMMPDALYGRVKENLRSTASDAYNKFGAANNDKLIAMPDIKKEIEAISTGADKYKSLSYNKKIADGMEDLANKFKTPALSEEAIQKQVVSQLQSGIDPKKIKLEGLSPATEISVADAVANKRAVWKMVEDFDLDRSQRRVLSSLADKMDKSIIEQAKSQKMPYASDFSKANQTWKGLRAGESVVDTLKEAVKNKQFNSVTMRTLLGKFPEGAYTAIGLKLAGVPYAASGGLALVGQELLQTYKFLSKTPGVWKEIAASAADITKGSATHGAARLAKLDDKLAKREAAESKKRASRGI